MQYLNQEVSIFDYVQTEFTNSLVQKVYSGKQYNQLQQQDPAHTYKNPRGKLPIVKRLVHSLPRSLAAQHHM